LDHPFSPESLPVPIRAGVTTATGITGKNKKPGNRQEEKNQRGIIPGFNFHSHGRTIRVIYNGDPFKYKERPGKGQYSN
jgi:hypothetical protein